MKIPMNCMPYIFYESPTCERFSITDRKWITERIPKRKDDVKENWKVLTTQWFCISVANWISIRMFASWTDVRQQLNLVDNLLFVALPPQGRSLSVRAVSISLTGYLSICSSAFMSHIKYSSNCVYRFHRTQFHMDLSF